MKSEPDEVVTYLYPCPFCACQHADLKNEGFAGFYISCHNCGIQVKGETKDTAIFKWQCRKS